MSLLSYNAIILQLLSIYLYNTLMHIISYYLIRIIQYIRLGQIKMIVMLVSIFYLLWEGLGISIPNVQELERTIHEISKFSQTHPCISQQISNLKPRCHSMTDSQKARTALVLTNCLLIQSRKPSYHCPIDSPIEGCLQKLEGDAWTSYSSFYLHVDSLCYYFTSLDWEERTSSLISNLTSVSHLTHSALQSHLRQTEHIIDIQSDLSDKIIDSLSLQKQLRESMRSHQSDIQKMAGDLEDTIQSLEQNVNKHYRVITEIFNSIDEGIVKLSSFQSILLGSIQEGIGSILYYLFLLGSVFVLSVISKGIRERFVSNLVLVLVSMGSERMMKFLGFSELAWRLRCIMFVWMCFRNLMNLNRRESLEVKVLDRIQKLGEDMNEKMGSARIRRVVYDSQVMGGAVKGRNQGSQGRGWKEDARSKTC